MMNIRDTLKQVFLFDEMTEGELDRIAAFCSVAELPRGAHLFAEGDQALALFAVLDGQVKMFKLSPDGTEQILGIFGPGHLVAEAAVFGLGTYPAWCGAISDSRLLRIPKDAFIGLILQYPELSLKIIQGYSRRLRYFVGLVEKLSLQDFKARLASYILEHSVADAGKSAVCRLTMTKRELAALLGTTPETLSRTLRTFKDLQLIEEQEGVLHIPNRRRLEALV